jgi:Mg2+/citrate symporter
MTVRLSLVLRSCAVVNVVDAGVNFDTYARKGYALALGLALVCFAAALLCGIVAEFAR